MGDHSSKLELPHCATLHFQPSKESSSVVNFDNVMLLVRAISSVIPVLGMIQLTIPAKLLEAKASGDKVIQFFANVSALNKLFVKSKIDKAKIESAICLINAEMLAIKNRRIRMLNPNISVEDRRLEVVPALHSCEKILELFSDRSNCFWSEPIPSSEYLLLFAALYLECLSHALYLIPSYRLDVTRALVKIVEVLKLYQTNCLDARLKQTYCHCRGRRPESDAEIVELIDKIAKRIIIPRRTYFGDKWPSASTASSSDLSAWEEEEHSNCDRCTPNLVYAMEGFLRYRRATRELYASKFSEVINLSSQMSAKLS